MKQARIDQALACCYEPSARWDGENVNSSPKRDLRHDKHMGPVGHARVRVTQCPPRWRGCVRRGGWCGRSAGVLDWCEWVAQVVEFLTCTSQFVVGGLEGA